MLFFFGSYRNNDKNMLWLCVLRCMDSRILYKYKRLILSELQLQQGGDGIWNLVENYTRLARGKADFKNKRKTCRVRVLVERFAHGRCSTPGPREILIWIDEREVVRKPVKESDGWRTRLELRFKLHERQEPAEQQN